MNVPSLTDQDVKVWAYITDESFGYDHWRAAQFSAPAHDKPAILMLFNTEAERNHFFESRKPKERE